MKIVFSISAVLLLGIWLLFQAVTVQAQKVGQALENKINVIYSEL